MDGTGDASSLGPHWGDHWATIDTGKLTGKQSILAIELALDLVASLVARKTPVESYRNQSKRRFSIKSLIVSNHQVDLKSRRLEASLSTTTSN